MAGKGDRAGAADDGAGWLGGLFGVLKAVVDESVEVLVAEDKPANTAEVEKRMRTVGVIARTAKFVDDLRRRACTASPREDEDEMTGGHDDHERDERLRAQLVERYDQLEGILEQKRAAAAERAAARARVEESGSADPSGGAAR